MALAAGLLRELQQSHALDTSSVDDVVMGCVMPVGEQRGDIAKTIAQFAARAKELEEAYGERFVQPTIVSEEISRSESFE